MNSTFKRLGKETAIYGLGSILNKLGAFLLFPLYTRLFAPSDYGILDVMLTMTVLAAVVLSAGTETSLSYYFFQNSSHVDRRKTITTTALYLLVVNTFVATLAWLWAKQLTGLVFGDPKYSTSLRLAILSIPFSVFFNLNLNILRINRKPWLYICLNSGSFLLSILLNIVLVVWLKWGVNGVFVTNLIVATAFSIAGFVVNRMWFGALFEWKRLRALLRYGSPLIVAGLSMWSINYLDRYFLLRFSNLNEIGLYSVGLRVASLIVFVTDAFRISNAPFQFEIAQDVGAQDIYARTLSYYVLITTLLCVPLSLFALPLLQIIAGPSYRMAYKVVPLAAYAAVTYGLYQIVGAGLLVTKKTAFTGAAIAFGALINVVYLFLLVPPYGMIGAALATLLAHITIVAILFVGAQRAYPIPYDLGYVTRVTTLAVSVILPSMALYSSSLWKNSLIAVGLFVVFLLLLPLLRLIDKRDQQVIFAVASKAMRLILSRARRESRV